MSFFRKKEEKKVVKINVREFLNYGQRMLYYTNESLRLNEKRRKLENYLYDSGLDPDRDAKIAYYDERIEFLDNQFRINSARNPFKRSLENCVYEIDF